MLGHPTGGSNLWSSSVKWSISYLAVACLPRALVSMQVQSMRDRMRLGNTKLSTVVDPINAPVCSEPDQGNGQGEGQDQAEKLAMSPPSKVQWIISSAAGLWPPVGLHLICS